MTNEPPVPPEDDRPGALVARPDAPATKLETDPKSAAEIGAQYDGIVNGWRRRIAWVELGFGAFLLLCLFLVLLNAALAVVPAEANPALVPIIVSLGAGAAFMVTNGRRDLIPFQWIYRSKNSQLPASLTDAARNVLGDDE